MEIKLPSMLTAEYHEDGEWNGVKARFTGRPCIEIKFGDAPIVFIPLTDEQTRHDVDEWTVNKIVAEWLRERLGLTP